MEHLVYLSLALDGGTQNGTFMYLHLQTGHEKS